MSTYHAELRWKPNAEPFHAPQVFNSWSTDGKRIFWKSQAESIVCWTVTKLSLPHQTYWGSEHNRLSMQIHHTSPLWRYNNHNPLAAGPTLRSKSRGGSHQAPQTWLAGVPKEDLSHRIFVYIKRKVQLQRWTISITSLISEPLCQKPLHCPFKCQVSFATLPKRINSAIQQKTPGTPRSRTGMSVEVIHRSPPSDTAWQGHWPQKPHARCWFMLRMFTCTCTLDH